MQYTKGTNDILLALGISEARAAEIEEAVSVSIEVLKEQGDEMWSFDLVAAGAAHVAETPAEAYYLASVIFMLQTETQNIMASVEQTIASNN